MTVSPPAVTLTERLCLLPCCFDDLTPLHEINADPRSWDHDPSGRHATSSVTRSWIERAAMRWQTDGLSYWTARLGATGEVVGVGGAQRHVTGSWNVYYRLAPDMRGHGYATEIARAGVEAALRCDPDVPVIAWILPHNVASLRVVERLGFVDYGAWDNPAGGGVHRVYADRPVAQFLAVST
jgi:RimJ/RimL family protein N-acetyltransferase